MPPKRKAANTRDFVEEEAEEEESGGSSDDFSESGYNQREISRGSSQAAEDVEDQSRITPPSEEEEEEEIDEDVSRADETITENNKRKRRKTVVGTKGWRRLAVEEKESLVNEGGIVWKAAQSLLRRLPNNKIQKEAANHLRTILRNIEVKLDSMLVPQTTRMPHASRNVASIQGINSAPTGSLVGSIMSWQMERGEKSLDEGEEEEESKYGEIALLELGGFSSDIAVLESLLLPEATETVSMNKAIEEQEKLLISSREQLSKLKADRELRATADDMTSSELQQRLQKARSILHRSSSSHLSKVEATALQNAPGSTEIL